MVYTFAFRFSKRSQLFTVNPVVFERIKKLGIPIALLPDPVESADVMSKQDARIRLGLPTNGRYIGHVGAADRRKAIPELLQGFISAKEKGDHLILAGRIDPVHRACIDTNFSDAIRDGSILLFDQFLSRDEFTTFISACDVIAPLSYPRAELSANFLNAVILGRTVVADGFGYTGRMIETFGLGARCNVHDSVSISAAIREAFDMSAAQQMHDAAEKLGAFHKVDNFGATLRQTICKLTQMPMSEQPLYWDSLVQDLSCVDQRLQP